MIVMYLQALVVIALSLSVLMAGAWVVQQRTGNSGWVDTIWTFSLGLVGAGSALWPVWDASPTARQWLVAALVAPFDGTIISVDVAAGETVVPGRVAVLLGDLSKYQIETTDLSERDVARVKVGQTVNVSIEALGETFTGKVTSIALVSSTLGGDVVYTVTIELDEQPQGLLWGMSADVEIQIE